MNTSQTNLTASVNLVSTNQTLLHGSTNERFLSGKVSSVAPTFTGIAAAYFLSVSNKLLVEGTNIVSRINGTVAIVNNRANTADVADTCALKFALLAPCLWLIDPLLTTPKLMIDTSAFSTSQTKS